ncbi:hypothetical protein MAH1_34730 [Sessilibacter sp. MAH1]
MHTRISTVVLSTLVLTACGGGGGGGNSTPPENVTISTSPSISIEENSSLSVAVEAGSDNSASTGITFSVSGGTDADLFSFNGSNLVASANFDFENPQDSNGDNVYEFQVTATSSTGATATAPFTVEVGNVVEISFQSTTDASVEENTSFSLPITASADGVASNNLTLSITGGADAQLFTISDSGDSLVASQTFDFEDPLDGDTDNVYEVEVSATDNTGATTSELFQVSVTNQFILSHELVFPTQNSNIATETTLEELQASGKTEFEAVAKLIDLEDGEVTAEEAATMISFTINGQNLVQSAEFPDFWSVTVPVVPGANDFQSELVATANNTETQTITAFNNLLYANPQFLDISSDGNLVYFSAEESSLTSTLILEFNINTSVYRLVSSDITADGAPLIGGSGALTTGVLDENNQRLFFLGASFVRDNTIVEIDLATGTRSQTPITFAPDTANTSAEIFGYDSSQNLIYLSDSRGVFTLNPDTEVITTLGFSSSRNLTLDSTNNRILIPNTTALSSYNITTGTTSTLFTYSNAGVEFTPDRVDLSSENRVVLSSRTEAVRVNLSDLSITELASVDAIAAGDNPISSASSGDVFFSNFNDSLYNFAGTQRLTSLNGNNEIYQSVINEGGEGDFFSPFRRNFFDIEPLLDPESRKIYQADQNDRANPTEWEFFEIDLTNGNKTLLFDQDDFSSVGYTGFTSAMTFDDNRENIYFIDTSRENLYRINLESLQISFVSVLSIPFTSTDIELLKLEKLEGRDTLLLSNARRPAVGFFEIDVFSGEVQPISTSAAPNDSNPSLDLIVGSGPNFIFSVDFVFNPQNTNEVFVLDEENIFSLDLTTGERNIISATFTDDMLRAFPLDILYESESSFLIFTVDADSALNQSFRYSRDINEFAPVFGSISPSLFSAVDPLLGSVDLDESRQLYYYSITEGQPFDRAIYSYSPISQEYIALSF